MRILFLGSLCLLISGVLWGGDRIHIEKTSTKIVEKLLIGSVEAGIQLTISPLSMKEGAFRGDYQINVDTKEVPFPFRSIAKGKEEEGYVILPSALSIAEIMEKGTVLKGYGYCPEKNNEERKIICRIVPDEGKAGKGKVFLDIDSGKRRMLFTSQYHVEFKTEDLEGSSIHLASAE